MTTTTATTTKTGVVCTLLYSSIWNRFEHGVLHVHLIPKRHVNDGAVPRVRPRLSGQKPINAASASAGPMYTYTYVHVALVVSRRMYTFARARGTNRCGRRVDSVSSDGRVRGRTEETCDSALTTTTTTAT